MPPLPPSLFTLWAVLAAVAGQPGPLDRYTTTPFFCDDPNPVTELAVTMSSYSSFKLTWTPPSNILERCVHAYNVTVHDGDSRLVCSHSVWRGYYDNDATYPCHTTVCTNYTAAVSVVGYPAVSSPTYVSFYTGAAKAGTLAASQITARKALLTWTSPDTLACAKHYKMYVSAYNGSVQQDYVYETRLISLSKTSFLLGGLESCKDNHVRLATVDKYGGENHVSVIVHTGDGHPPKVRALSSGMNQGYSVSVSWQPASNFKPECHAGYRVCSISDMDGSSHCYFTSDTRYTVKSLTACTSYTISVQTVDAELREDSHRSTENQLRVFTNPAIPTTTVLAGTAQMSQMLFERPDNYSSSCLSHYEMMECVERPYTGGGCQQLHHDLLPANITSYNSSMLTACATSHLYFYAVGKNGGKSYLDFKYINDQGTLQPLTNLTLVSATTKHITLAWTPSDFNDCPHSYRVCWYLNKYRTCSISSRDSGDTFRNISLRACSDYSAQVWLMNRRQTTNAKHVTFQTGPENANQQSVQLTPTSALVTWSRDTSTRRCSTGYSITWCPASIFSNTCETITGSVSLTGTTTHYNMTGLETCARYLLVFQTLGRNASLVSEPNATVIRTPVGKFGPITDLTIHHQGNNTVVLDIVFPNNSTKCVTKFTTCLYETNSNNPEKYCRLMRTEWVNKTQSCTTYTVDITAVAYNKQTSNGSITFQTGPGQVSDIVVKYEEDREAANVTWVNPGRNASRCVQYLEVMLTPAEASVPVVQKRLPSDATSILLQRLSKCTSYVFQVQAFTAGYARGNVVVKNFTTTWDVLEKVRELKLNTSERQFSVSWQPPIHSSCVVSYRICWSAEGASTSCETSYTNNWTSSQFDTLEPCLNYTVSVASLDKYGRSSDNETATFQTGAASVSDVVAKVSSSNKAVTVTWNYNESNLRCVSYQVVSFIRTDDYVTFRRNVSKEAKSAGYGGLQFCRSYEIKVQPITMGSTLPPAVSTQIHTPSNVRSLSSLEVTGISQHTLHVAYNISDVSSYCVGYFEVCWQTHGGNKTCANYTGHTSSSRNISGLSAGTNYTVQVTPVSPEGQRYKTSTSAASTLRTGAMMTDVEVQMH